MTAEEIIERLQLMPLPNEGGFFRETYRSEAMIVSGDERRAHGTAIYFLVTPDHFSALHRLPIDEVWHFYMGDPVEQICLHEDGTLETIILGNDLFAQPQRQHPQSVVSAGIWQGTRLSANGRFALLGTTMAPGFEFSDLEMADRASLCHRFPEHASSITSYTHS